MSRYGLRAIEFSAEEFDIPIDEALTQRKQFCLRRITRNKEFQRVLLNGLSGSNMETREFILDSVERHQMVIGEYQKQIAMINNYKPSDDKDFITPEMIERARRYPLEDLIEFKSGMAKCINHEDKHPSMNCRNNFVYCHACGYKGDVIDVFIKLSNVSFPEAIRRLQ